MRGLGRPQHPGGWAGTKSAPRGRRPKSCHPSFNKPRRGRCAEGRSPYAGSLRVSLRYPFPPPGRGARRAQRDQGFTHSSLYKLPRCKQATKRQVCRGAKPLCRESEGVPQIPFPPPGRGARRAQRDQGFTHSSLYKLPRCKQATKRQVCRGARPLCRESEGVPQTPFSPLPGVGPVEPNATRGSVIRPFPSYQGASKPRRGRCADGRSPYAGSLRVSLRYPFPPPGRGARRAQLDSGLCDPLFYKL